MSDEITLKLSDEEKQALWNSVVSKTDQTTLLSATYGIYTDLVEKAATAKAAWEIFRWLEDSWTHMGSQGTYISMMDQLIAALEAAGVQRPK